MFLSFRCAGASRLLLLKYRYVLLRNHLERAIELLLSRLVFLLMSGILVVVITLRHLLVFPRYTGHARVQLMPFWLLSYSVLHCSLSYLSLLLFLKELIASMESPIRHRWLAVGTHSVLRLDITSWNYLLNVLLECRLIMARAHILDGFLV